MAAPLSTFLSAAPGSLSWVIRSPNGNRRCQTTGFAFIAGLQRALSAAVPPRTPSYDGRASASNPLTIDARWGPATERSLWAALKGANAPANLLTAVAADARAQRISVGSFLGAIWFLHHMAGAIDNAPVPLPALTDIVVPGGADMVLPRWGIAPPAAPEGNPVCVGAGAVPPPQPTPQPPAPQPQPQPQPTPQPQPGPPVDQGGSEPNITPLPGGNHEVVRQSGSSVQWPLVVGVVAVLAVGAWVATSLAKGSKAGGSKRRTTRRRR